LHKSVTSTIQASFLTVLP